MKLGNLHNTFNAYMNICIFLHHGMQLNITNTRESHIIGLNFLSRSYYRCTNSKCTVKKRVERSSNDPSVVITTYEGQHCHHIGPFHRGSGGGGGGAAAARYHSAAAVALAEQMSSTSSSFIPARHLYNLPPLHPQSSLSSETVVSSATTTTSFQHVNDGDELRRASYSSMVSMAQSPSTPPSVPPAAISVEKAGLLDDMVPHGVRHGTP